MNMNEYVTLANKKFRREVSWTGCRAYCKDFFNNTHSWRARERESIMGAEPPVGVQGAEPPGSGGKAPLKPTRFWCLKQ